MVQPVAQQARTHRRAAVVEQRKQGGRAEPSWPRMRFGQFQVAAGGGIQADEFVFGFDGQARTCCKPLPWVDWA